MYLVCNQDMSRHYQLLHIADMVLNNFLLFFNETPHFIYFNRCEFQFCYEIFVKFLTVFRNNTSNIPNSIEMVTSNYAIARKPFFSARCLQIVVISFLFKCLRKNGVLIVRTKFLWQSLQRYFCVPLDCFPVRTIFLNPTLLNALQDWFGHPTSNFSIFFITIHLKEEKIEWVFNSIYYRSVR